MNKEDFQKSMDKTKDFFSKKIVQWVSVILLLLIVVTISSSIRLSNLDLLKDSTTGEAIPLALDPYYFLRIGETILENGPLPECDDQRISPNRCVGWSPEIMPRLLAITYPLVNALSNISFRFYDVISPVIFYIIGIGLFFALMNVLTRNKWLSLGASSLLAFTSAYLYRTMAGFADHESIGMAALFLAFLIFVLAIKFLTKKEKVVWWKSLIWGFAVGLSSSLVLGSWGGVGKFLFIIFPLTYFLIWLFHYRGKDHSFIYTSWIFYASWVVSTILFSLIIKIDAISYLSSPSGLISLTVLGFIFIDGFLQIFSIKFIKEKLRVLYSLCATGILGFIGMFFVGRNPFILIRDIVAQLLHPFGTSRVGLTVAENAQPYLTDWISNTGKPIFWLFILGVVLLGFYLVKKIKKKGHKYGFFLTYVLMVAGIVFSRISASSVLNGENFLSGIFYFIPLIGFWVYFFYLYLTKRLEWGGIESFLFSWMFFTLISGRAALRMFFAITPFMCFMAAYLVFNLCKDFNIKKKENLWYVGLFGGLFLWFLFSNFGWWNGAGWLVVLTWLLKLVFLALISGSSYFLYKNSKIKDDLSKILILVGVLISVFILISGIFQSYQAISYTAKYTGPSANNQWQNTMAWVRENTSEDSIFNHWWDYGYWVETLGERATISDGGHFQGETINHNVGRYVLTTPIPETAYSFLKTMGTNYFLIDPTDIGKYSAYSKIGSDQSWDRYSFMPYGTYSESQVQETANETTYIYNVQGIVDEDLIFYDKNGQKIFLPGPTYDEIGSPTYNSYMIGVILTLQKGNLVQPTAVYLYNNKQYKIPVRYVYIGEKLYDFGSGYEAALSIIPSVSSTNINAMGAMIYLSPKIKNSLFAQLYLMDDAFGNYENFELAHEEDADLVKSLKSQGYNSSEFVYYSGSIFGPIKIYNVSNYPEGTPVYEDFNVYVEGRYAYMDELFE